MEGLKLILDKLSGYNFLTNILPGTVLCILLKYIVGYDLIVSGDWYISGIIFYFVGMTNNRFGSVVIEEIAKKTGFVCFSNYKDYIKAEEKDDKIKTISTDNNVYRSYVSVLLLTLLAYVYKFSSSHLDFLEIYKVPIILCLLLLLFAASYRKQSLYVNKRVDCQKGQSYEKFKM